MQVRIQFDKSYSSLVENDYCSLWIAGRGCVILAESGILGGEDRFVQTHSMVCGLVQEYSFDEITMCSNYIKWWSPRKVGAITAVKVSEFLHFCLNSSVQEACQFFVKIDLSSRCIHSTKSSSSLVENDLRC